MICAETQKMKRLLLSLLTSIAAAGQAPGTMRVIAFDRSDAEHCKVVTIEGRPMLQTTFGGTSVAVGLPLSTGRGDFRVFVVIQQPGSGKAQVRPREFTALYSDPAHTRFPFYDKAAEIQDRTQRQQTEEPAIVSASSQGDPGMSGMALAAELGTDNTERAMMQRQQQEDPNGPARAQEEAREAKQGHSPGTVVPPGELYLRACTLRQGKSAEGFVYFRQPKGSNLKIGFRDQLFEVDIPVNGIVFSFS